MAFAQAFQGAYGLVERSRRNAREQELQDELLARQRAQWGREDAAQAQMQQLAFDQQYGLAVPGTDNSYDIAEAKRFGVPPPASTLQRTPISDIDVEDRLGQISLGAGDVRGFRESRERKKGLKKEADAKAFGQRMQAFLSGDDSAFMDEIRQGNLDGSVRGTLGRLPDGNYAYTDPESGEVVPLSRAEVGTLLQQAWAFGQGDLVTGFKAMSEQQTRETAKRTEKEGKRRFEVGVGLEERKLSQGDARMQETMRHNQAVEGLARGRLGVDQQRLAQEKLGRMGTPIPTVGPDGQPSLTVPTMTPGGLQMHPVQLPPGHRLLKQADPKVQLEMALELVGTPTGRLISGKPEMHTLESAMASVNRIMFGDQQGGAMQPAISEDARKIVEFLRSQAAPAAPPAPAGGGLRAPMTQQDRLRQLYLGR